MRELNWRECLVAAGKSENWFKTVRRRRQVALAWGLSEQIPYGKYTEADAVALRLLADMGEPVGLTRAAEVMRVWNDSWLEAIVDADGLKSETVYLVYIEYDSGTPNERCAIGHTTLSLIQKPGMFENPSGKTPPTKMVFLNITATLQKVRANAAKIGLDLSAPFLPARGDPRFEKMIHECARAREEAFVMIRENVLA
jgi:hypothetical protein